MSFNIAFVVLVLSVFLSYYNLLRETPKLPRRKELIFRAFDGILTLVLLYFIAR